MWKPGSSVRQQLSEVENAQPLRAIGGKFLANERLMRNCGETNEPQCGGLVPDASTCSGMTPTRSVSEDECRSAFVLAHAAGWCWLTLRVGVGLNRASVLAEFKWSIHDDHASRYDRLLRTDR